MVSLLSGIMLVRFLNIVILTTHSHLIGKGFRYVALRCPMSLSARTPTFLLGMCPGVQWLGHHVYVRSGFVDTRGGFSAAIVRPALWEIFSCPMFSSTLEISFFFVPLLVGA